MKALKQSKALDLIYYILVCTVLVCLVAMVPMTYYFLTEKYFLVRNLPRIYALVTAVLFVVTLLKFRPNFPAEAGLLSAFFLWNIICQSYNGSSLRIDGILPHFANFFCVFSVGYFLKDSRDKVLTAVTVIFALFLAVFGVVGLVALSKGYGSPGVLGGYVKITDLDTKYIEYFGYYRIITSSWFFAGIFFALYYIVKSKKPAVKIIFCLLLVLFFAIVSVQRCRSVNISLSFAAAMIAGICVFHFINLKFTPKLIIACVLSAFCAIGCYMGISATDTLIRGIISETAVINEEKDVNSEEILSSEEESDDPTNQVAVASDDDNFAVPNSQGTVSPVQQFPTSDQVQPAFAEEVQTNAELGEQAPAISDADTRNFKNDFTTLNLRTILWGYGFEFIKENPSVLLFGQSQDTYMDGIHNNGKPQPVPWPHMHNSVLQALMLSGIPGALLLVAFVVIFLYRTFKYCIFKPYELCLSQKLLSVAPVSLLFYGFMEPLLYTGTEIVSLLSMLLLGIFVEYCREADNSKPPKHMDTD